ncbi:MAG: hypothetical protein ACXADO_03200 [Candidatus Thorarchaeota archaeon]|jgi:hypothetical protein
MAVDSVQGEIRDSRASTGSRLTTALNIYLQGLVVAVFGALFYAVFLWLPLDYRTTGLMVGFWVGSYVLGAVNSRLSRRFWSQDHRFSDLTLLGQGAVLLFVCMIVLASATTVYTIQVVGGPQIDPVFQIQLGLAATLIAPPLYGHLAKDVASWRISPSDRARVSSRVSR